MINIRELVAMLQDNVRMDVTVLRMDAEGMVERAKTRPDHAPNRVHDRFFNYARNRNAQFGHESAWMHAKSTAEVEDALMHGDPATTAFVQSLIDKIVEVQPVAPRRRIRYRDEGDEVCETRYVERDYDHMWRRTEKEMRVVGNKTIDIGFWFGGNAGEGEDSLRLGGAACAALVDKLEGMGYSVGVRGFMDWANGPMANRLFSELHIKHPGEPLNLELLAATVARASTFRLYGLAVVQHAHFDMGSHHGYPIHSNSPHQAQKLLDALTETRIIDPCSIVLPKLRTVEQAREVLDKSLAMLVEGEQDLRY
jgi:hypothetical protein